LASSMKSCGSVKTQLFYYVEGQPRVFLQRPVGEAEFLLKQKPSWPTTFPFAAAAARATMLAWL
jgi:hypothetical protein